MYKRQGSSTSTSNSTTGLYNFFVSSGGYTGTVIGIKNGISLDQDGKQYGIKNDLNNSGNGFHYGVRNYLAGAGTGLKYGTYNKIESTAGGTHFAVYGEAEKAGSYAGYFKGDVYTSQKLKAPDSGDTDMKAYIYGSITGSGYLSTNGSHSDGFTVTHQGTGAYKVTFTGTNKPTDAGQYTVLANMRYNNIGFITVRNYNTYFTIKTYYTSGTVADKPFNFVVYKK